MKTARLHRNTLFCGIALALAPSIVLAQQADPADAVPAQTQADIESLDAVVGTGVRRQHGAVDRTPSASVHGEDRSRSGLGKFPTTWPTRSAISPDVSISAHGRGEGHRGAFAASPSTR